MQGRIRTGFEIANAPGTVAPIANESNGGDGAEKQEAPAPAPAVADDGAAVAAALSVEKDLGESLTKCLTSYLASVQDFPIEAMDKILSLLECASKIDGAKTCRTEQDLNSIMEGWENQKVLQNQVYKALKTASKDLSEVQKGRKKEADSLARDNKLHQERQRAEELKRQQVLDTEAAASFALSAQRRSFSFPWATCGHTAIRTFDSISDVVFLKEPFSKNDDHFATPFIVKGDLLDDATFKTGADVWHGHFQKAMEKKTSTSALKQQAEMKDQHGKAAVVTALKQLHPDTYVSSSVLPSVAAACEAPFFFGFGGAMVSHDTEPSCLGTMRHFTHGTANLLLACPVEFQANFQKVLEIHACDMGESPKFSASNMQKWMQSLDAKDLSDEQVKQLKNAGLNVFHGLLKSPGLLVIPPGLLVAMSSAKPSDNLTGIRKSFLPLSQTAARRLGVLAKSLPESDLVKTLDSTVKGLETDLRSR